MTIHHFLENMDDAVTIANGKHLRILPFLGQESGDRLRVVEGERIITASLVENSNYTKRIFNILGKPDVWEPRSPMLGRAIWKY
jgi:hypothetical protein